MERRRAHCEVRIIKPSFWIGTKYLACPHAHPYTHPQPLALTIIDFFNGTAITEQTIQRPTLGFRGRMLPMLATR